MTIKRRTAPYADDSYEWLRTEGLRLLQAHSRQYWTDYNVHDPGVTMLDALCYALTDLVYRAQMPIADHLTGADGRIDFARQSLHPPTEAFACRPTTVEDIRCALLDAAPSVDDVVVQAVGDGAGNAAPSGLYRIDVQVFVPPVLFSQGTGSSSYVPQQDDVLATVAAAYRGMRCAGEDMQVVAAMIVQPCRLHASIETAGGRDPTDILADIYDRCYRYLASPDIEGGEHLPSKDQRALDQILDGPALNSTYMRSAMAERGESRSSDILADRCQRQDRQLCIDDLSTVIAAIPGVVNVVSLQLAVGDDAPQTGSVAWRWRSADDEERFHALQLVLPAVESDETVQLLRRGSVLRLPIADLHAKFCDRQARERVRYTPTRLPSTSKQQLAAIFAPTLPSATATSLSSLSTLSSPPSTSPVQATEFPLPKGNYFPSVPFTSAQLHFPAIYGLNRYGVPTSASTAEHAAVRQVKAYLALCDQAMAHSACQIRHAGELFSAEWPTSQSYWWEMLGEESLPGIQGLYKEPQSTSDMVRQIYAPFDRFYDRKNRVLDYLLALYGETYTQGSLRKFSPFLDEGELSRWLLRNKTRFVKEILRMGRDRAGGFDYGKPSWDKADNCSGLQYRIGLLLGFEHVHCRSLTRVITERHLHFDSATYTDAAASRLYKLATQPPERLPIDWPSLTARSPVIEAKVKLILRQPGLARLMQRGQYREHYRLLKTGGGLSCELLLDGAAASSYYQHLALCVSAEEACQIAARLRDCLLGLNHQCEGLFLVEHCLLRPIAAAHGHGVDTDFFRLRISFVLPAWTPRAQLDGYVPFAEETVALNCPAHLQAHCVWLNFSETRDFESAYRDWLDARQIWCDDMRNRELIARTDARAARLVQMLLQHISASESTRRKDANAVTRTQ